MKALAHRFKLTTLLIGLALFAAPASAAAGPVWTINSNSNTTVAEGGELRYYVDVINIGDEASDGSEFTLTATLPDGFTLIEAPGPESAFSCPGANPGDTVVVCAGSSQAGIGVSQKVRIAAKAEPGGSGIKTAEFEIEGGGAAAASTVDPVRVSPAPPGFEIDAFDVSYAKESGDPYTQAGGHPFTMTNWLDFTKATVPLEAPLDFIGFGDRQPVEPPKDIEVSFPPGFAGIPKGVGQCSVGDLSRSEQIFPLPLCSPDSQVGTASVIINGQFLSDMQGPLIPVFNMLPPPGAPARFGFNVFGTVVTLDARLRSESDYGVTAVSRNTSQGVSVSGAIVSLWGVPAADVHDFERACSGQLAPAYLGGTARCDSGAPKRPFFRMPTSCEGALQMGARADSWHDQGDFKQSSMTSHELPGYPHPREEWGAPAAMSGCELVPVRADLDAQATALDTESPSGLEVHLEVPNPGLTNPDGIASSDIKRTKVTLPQGMTINPSQAEGLGVCSSARYESTRLEFHPDGEHGCPTDSKIGTVSVRSPLLDEVLPGDVYVAKPHDNPFDSLLAIYVVIAEPERGILIKLPGEVTLNETTGRIETDFRDLPQLPFESFDFRFREGARAPLITPPTCGAYETEAEFTGWSDPDNPITRTSSFEITGGIGGGTCPSGAPGFEPGFSAGSVNNNAGSFSEFVMRLTRNDGEQDMTKFSSILPPGVSAKIAGVAKCPEAAIAGAESKTGLQERANPSCPASSQIGRSLVGAGVGSVLTYVPGQLYLAGPYNGAPLSVVSITPAVAGPFDIGTVVVREALSLDPVTAEVRVDGDRSDPIPHILKGIPLKLRDLRVYVDRENFTINPTNCDPASVRATLFGSNLDVFNPADDVPVALSSRYQAASCASLGFKPNLKIRLRGGTKRGAHPGLRAVVTPRKGDANIDGATVTLPRSAFLEQAHIRTICTRVQFAANACPPAAIYGRVTAWTPLLDEPLSGPVYLRSSSNKLPDLVFDLKGIVEIEVPGRIDSVNGGIRATFANVPDAPISRVVLEMQGGKKGLIVNSANLCATQSRAKATFTGQNGKERRFRPVIRVRCGKKRKREGRR